MNIVEKVVSYIPIIKEPKELLTFNDRLKHTFIILVLYFILASIPIWGVSVEISERLRELMWVFGSAFGTIVSLGIGPIVMAGIFLQLLIGGEVLKININTPEGREKYDNYMRFLTIVFIVIESLAILITGSLKPDLTLGINPLILYLVIFAQLFLGGLFIVLLDDYSLKYGITSGVNLFILASISRALVIRLFNPFPSEFHNAPTGLLFTGINLLTQGNLNEAIGMFLVIKEMLIY